MSHSRLLTRNVFRGPKPKKLMNKRRLARAVASVQRKFAEGGETAKKMQRWLDENPISPITN